MAVLVARSSMSKAKGRTEMAFIAPLPSRPSLINCVWIVFTRSVATFSIVENSLLNSLPNVLVDAPAYLKVSPKPSLFLSRALVKDSAVVDIVLTLAANFPVALILLIRLR